MRTIVRCQADRRRDSRTPLLELLLAVARPTGTRSDARLLPRVTGQRLTATNEALATRLKRLLPGGLLIVHWSCTTTSAEAWSPNKASSESDSPSGLPHPDRKLKPRGGPMWWILFLVLGLGAGSWLTIHIIADYPPPDSRTKLVAVSVSGGVGGLVGGALFGRLLTVASDPMPLRAVGALAGIIGLGLFFGAMTAIAAGFADKPAR